jgi:hypothetical protein
MKRYLWPVYVDGEADGVRIADEMVENFLPEHRFIGAKDYAYRRHVVKLGPYQVDGYVSVEHDPSDAAAILLRAVVETALGTAEAEVSPPARTTREDNHHARSEEDHTVIGDPHRRP